MKSAKVAFLFSVLATLGAAQVLQDFSSFVGSNTYFYGTWELSGGNGTNTPNSSFVQGSGVYDITGATATNSDVSKVEFFFNSPISIGSNNYIQVNAQALSLNAATSFQVILIDTNSVSATATFNASSFLTGSYSIATTALTFGSGFNTSSVDEFIITGGIPSGNLRFNFSFNELKAVTAPIPEPSTYALIVGALTLGFVALRRRPALRA